MAEADPQFSRSSTTVPEPVEAASETSRSPWRKRALMASVPLLILAIGGYAYATSGRSVSTDNAYVKQDIVSVSSDVAGRIVEVRGLGIQPGVVRHPQRHAP